MGNLLSTEDIDEEYIEEPVKPERKKRRNKAKTTKRRLPVVVEEEDDGDSGFSFFSSEPQEDVIENIRMDVEPEVQKPKRKKRGASTVSRRKKVAWDEEDD